MDTYINVIYQKYRKSTFEKVFTFVRPSSNQKEDVNVGELFKKVDKISYSLKNSLDTNEKVLLILPENDKFLYSLLACWKSNIIAVVTPINSHFISKKDSDNLKYIINDSEPTLILSEESIFKQIGSLNENIKFLDINDVLKEINIEVTMDIEKQNLDDIALITYTSGSTSNPKGINLTHRNIYNQATAESWRIKKNDIIVSWVPCYHAFGMFISMLTPLIKQSYSVIIPTENFLRKPSIWFDLIEAHQANVAPCLNFAFEHTLNNLDEDKVYRLSSLNSIICAGEPIRENIWGRFYEKFSNFGIKYNSLLPLYGLSEVCPVSSHSKSENLEIINLDRTSLNKNKVKILDHNIPGKKVISCGKPQDIDLKIFCESENRYCDENEIGEIMLKSPRVAYGYHNKNIDICNSEGYFNTEDLGFLHNSNLYIVGRKKEIIIVNGKNYYPSDIEIEIKKYSDSFEKVAVFSIDNEQKELVYIVMEVLKLPNNLCKHYMKDIYYIVKRIFGLEIEDIIIVENDTLPITNSGKIQRLKCKTNYLKGELKILETMDENNNDEYLKMQIYEILKDSNKVKNNDDISEMSINDLDLSSIEYYQLAEMISRKLKINIKTIDLFKYHEIPQLINHINNMINKQDQNKEETEESSILNENEADKNKQTEETDIAIIGIDFKFPSGVEDKDELWEYLYEGKSAIKQINEERPEVLDLYERKYDGKKNDFSNWGGFVENHKNFDAEFFNLSRIEAESMDPQQRMVLQSTWKSIEDAGYSIKNFHNNKVGVFVGAHNTDYNELLNSNITENKEYGAYLDTGVHPTMISNRISRWYDFNGPSETINTACSSSLVAVHRAITSININECDIAVVSGVNSILAPKVYLACEDANMLSKDGKCKTFDSNADGFVRSEGCGTIVLKRLKSAELDRDNIYGVIKGSSVNHDGKTNSLRAPNINSQIELLKSAYKNAKVSTKNISYIELHGTGTKLGDPIEYEALRNVFTEVSTPIKLGAIKTNFGHMESAAGIAGLIKILLSFEKKVIPKIINFNKLNPEIDISNNNFSLVTENEVWNRIDDVTPRLAGINSFGFGGSNAHVVLEEYKNNYSEIIQEEDYYIIPLSARKKESIVNISKEIITYINNNKNKVNGFMDRLSYTLQVGRVPFEKKTIIVVKDTQELVWHLQKLISNPEEYIGEVKTTTNINDSDNNIINNWISNNEVNWFERYGTSRKCILHLPTYSFLEKEYWINDKYVNTDAHINNDRYGNEEDEFSGVSELKGYIRKIYSHISKIPVTDINTSTPLENYGIDSIMINKITKKIQEKIPGLSVTMLFECKNIDDISKYLVNNHNTTVKKIFTNYDEPRENPVNKTISSTEKKHQNDNFEGAAHKKDIAIIGISGEYPDASNLDEFWENLEAGRDSVKNNTFERWRNKINSNLLESNNHNTYWGSYLKKPLKFDSQFFGITPNEVYTMEPEERLFLQTVYNTLEDSGYTRQKLSKNSVGVYVGSTFLDSPIVGRDYQMEGKEVIFSGSSASIANRVSYYFNFEGPSLTVDTMCSSSLTALHLACQSIISEEIDVGVVGGVNLNLHPNKYKYLEKYNFLSETGKCKSFSEDGDGYTPGEGVGAILIKNLDQAIKDKDNIHGVIKNTSINHGGKANGFYVPNPVAQSKVINKCIRGAGINSNMISYIEAHGTGTSLGDPIEITGLTKAFNLKDKNSFCSIGSVKSNIGHLEAAAGICGLTKVLLQMKHRKLVPSLHAERENQHINFKNTPFYLQKKLENWNSGQSIYSGISSFGAGGANAHVILQNFERELDRSVNNKRLILLSAKTNNQLVQKCREMISFLEKRKNISLGDIEYTLLVGREHFDYRVSIIANNSKEVIHKLNQILSNEGAITNVKENNNIKDIHIDWEKIIEDLFVKEQLDSIAEIWKLGVEIDWDLYLEKNNKISLPTYPFEEKTFNLDPEMIESPQIKNEKGLYINEWIEKNI